MENSKPYIELLKRKEARMVASRQKHDPAVLQILKGKGLSYDEWADEAIWNFFHSALKDKNSDARSIVLKNAEEKLKAEAIRSYLSNSN